MRETKSSCKHLFFSCSRFELLTKTLDSLEAVLPAPFKAKMSLYEDQFYPGIETLTIRGRVIVQSPPLGLGSAFYRAYLESSIQSDYVLHLEDDWSFDSFPDYDWCIDLFERHGLDQVYLSSKLSLEQAVERWGTLPVATNGDFGVYLLDPHPHNQFSKLQRSGHLLPNTTPHIGRPGLFRNYVETISAQSQFDFFSIKSPKKAWKFWCKSLPPFLKVAILFRKRAPFLRHLGEELRHRVMSPTQLASIAQRKENES